MKKNAIETRVVENRLANPDGTFTTVKVTERRPAARHNSMQRHMAAAAAAAKRKQELSSDTPAPPFPPAPPAPDPAAVVNPDDTASEELTDEHDS